ncbi:MAG: helix-turn-helix transcriptional regulator, partial [Candidatus Promineifilaceae bacterium]
MNVEISFGKWLGLRRKRLDLTQATLAHRVGCAVSTLQKIEAGKRRPSPEFAGRLADVLGIKPSKRAAFIDLARGSQDLSIFELFLPPTNLPAQTTPLIGRERDVSHL